MQTHENDRTLAERTLDGKRILVVGGSRGLGRGIVEALVARNAKVTVVGREAGPLSELEQRFGVATVVGDAAEPALAGRLLRDLAPAVLVVNAGIPPVMAPIHEQTWDGFSAVWNHDVKLTFHWIQEAIRVPLASGSRVLVTSSGAAVNGSPLSGGYAGAKRMLWLMADYANGVAAEQNLGIRFQTLVPRQMVGGTGVGRAGAEAYSKRKGVTPEEFLKGFGKPMPPALYGEHVATVLTDPQYDLALAIGFKGDWGIQVLEPPPA